jgi:para-aminobenzoate synthetase/4-amino-4-deoxychorismate lyase
VVAAHRLPDVMPALAAVAKAVEERGLWAAGFVSYEAAPAFDPALETHPPDGFPLVWFLLGGEPRPLSHRVFEQAGPLGELAWTPSVGEAEYRRSIAAIKDRIRAGDTYQVNYTYRLSAPLSAPAWPLFARLVRGSSASHAAFVDTGRWSVCSASPELFLARDGEELVSRPMKGTAPRGRWSEEDLDRAERLAASEKDRAENTMIVDMVRNDLGRVARSGSVTVSALCEAEQLPTAWQLTSTVRARSGAGLAELMRALFPPASITGAPKISTMRIIRRLEGLPRRAYTGTVGFLAPERRWRLNVAIRTVIVDREGATAEYGVGGGVVWDSSPDAELAECETKARLLAHDPPRVALLESMLWTPELGIPRIDSHIRRLAASARYFGFVVDPERIRAALDRAAAGLPGAPHKLRLTVAPDGAPEVRAEPVGPAPERYTLGLARDPVDADDPFLFHKTTHREVYERALAHRPSGCDDVLLWNERGEITESAIGNVIVERDGGWWTPPLRCGLLPGVGRQELIDGGRVRERVVQVDELDRSEGILLVNAVRGVWRAELVR